MAGFVGDAVLLPGTADDGCAETPLGRLPLSCAPGSPAGTVVLRPEQLRLTAPESAAARGTVSQVDFYGHDAMVTVDVDGLDQSVEVRVSGPVAVRPGDRTGIRVTGEASLLA
ncbi:ABC-type Fe3+/spermidine/putrescine transport system ATPase subunit [Streptomyces sp. V4I23]|nr:ABC-type Fe3+/spermidine/putrescine transport system ATPase subunit [Streptomyces sp. V4I23]